ncbi:MAG TPA: hypothetical protein VN905_15180 [Candidatus Binatia bacterium]|nr:hypothetical protein [Candidatus Binatia bacterium]
MRDAGALETLGIPTVILVNDVFEPIAHATAALLNMPSSYVTEHVIWLPHPTSNLTKAQAAALIDERIERIRGALAGTLPAETASAQAADGEPLARARALVDGLTRSLRADGADLVLESYDDGVLRGRVVVGELTCEDGSCIMPAAQLAKMIEAMVRPQINGLHTVELEEAEA